MVFRIGLYRSKSVAFEERPDNMFKDMHAVNLTGVQGSRDVHSRTDPDH